MPFRKIETPEKVAAKSRLQQNAILPQFCWDIYADMERIWMKASKFVSPLAVQLANAHRGGNVMKVPIIYI
jgi:hypothetical protein